MTTLSLILRIVSSLFDALFAYLIVKSVANEKPRRIYKILFAVVFISAVLLSNFMNPSVNPQIQENITLLDENIYSISRLLFYGIVVFILASVSFYSKIVAKLFASVLYVVVIEVGEIFTYGVVLLFFPDFSYSIYSNTDTIYLLGLFSSYAYYFLVLVIMRYFPSRSLGALSLWQSFTLLAMPTISAVVIAILISFLRHSAEAYYALYLIPSLFFMLLLFFIVMFFKSIIDAQEQIKARDTLENQIERQIEQYKALQSANESLRAFQHDWKNHMLVIRSSLEMSDTDGATRYIRSVEDISPAYLMAYAYTGNITIDALLSNLTQKTLENGIELSINAVIPPTLNILVADLCVLISNALDNAYEACLNVINASKWIKVQLSYKQGYFYFSVENAREAKANIAKKNERFVSNKEHPELHGIGIKNMNAIAEKYGGHIEYSFDALSFTAKGMLKYI